MFDPASLAIGGVTAAADIYSANQQNKAASTAANAQMIFQQNMSDTAHQREVADLKAAGLNPILSAGGSGASTPGGASPPVTGVVGPAVAAGVSSALDYKRTKASADLATEQVNSEKVKQYANTASAVSALANARLAAAAAPEAENRAVMERKYPKLFGTIDALLGRGQGILSSAGHIAQMLAE
jgi:hypothetical protein